MIYVFVYKDTDDGEVHDLYAMHNAKTIEEAMKLYEQTVLNDIYDWADTPERRLKYLDSREFSTLKVKFMDVSYVVNLKIDNMIESIKKTLLEEARVEDEVKERQEYERLKQKYAN